MKNILLYSYIVILSFFFINFTNSDCPIQYFPSETIIGKFYHLILGFINA
jgi:hypothetical protein